MGMYHGMDLAQFKVHKRDKTSTTLRHSKGHEIRIAHKALTPKLQQMLDKLPMYAEGETVQPSEAMDDDSPAQADDTPAAAPQQDDADQPPAGNMVMNNAPPQIPPSAPNAVDQIPSDEDKGGNTVTAVAPRVKQELDQEAQNQNQDALNGHITQKGLGDLFANKDTPTKIGMILSMGLAGGGFALAHQSNALLDMLGKQLDGDRQAQMASAQNAQNWVKLGQQNEMNKSQIGLNDEHKKAMGIANAGNAMDAYVKAQAYGMLGRIPPAYQQQAQNWLSGTLEPYLDSRTQNRNDQTAISIGSQQKPNFVNGVDRNAVEGAALVAGAIPGATGAQKLRDDATAVEQVNMLHDRSNEAFKNLNTMNASQLGEAAGVGGQALTSALSAVKALIPTYGSAIEAAKHLTPEDADTLSKFDTYRNSQLDPLMARMGPMESDSVAEGSANKIKDAIFPNIYDLSAQLGMDSKTLNDVRKAKHESMEDMFQDREKKLAGSGLRSVPGAWQPMKRYPYTPVRDSAPTKPAEVDDWNPVVNTPFPGR